VPTTTASVAREPQQQSSSSELQQAKKSLLAYVTKCNQLEELLEHDFQIDQNQKTVALVKKFTIEIQHLRS
jgi:hypothetical protein